MDFIREYIMSIIVVMLFSVLLEMVMPGSSFKKYIKLVVGLLIMFVIVKPVINIPSLASMIAAYDLPAGMAQGTGAQVRDSIEQLRNEQVKAVFAQSLSERIEQDVTEAFGVVCDVAIEFDGEKITRAVLTADENYLKIADYIRTNYGIPMTEGGK